MIQGPRGIQIGLLTPFYAYSKNLDTYSRICDLDFMKETLRLIIIIDNFLGSSLPICDLVWSIPREP